MKRTAVIESDIARREIPKETHGLKKKLDLLSNYFKSSDRKLTWLKITISAALVFGFCFSWKLWISSRLFPLAPVSDVFPPVPFPFDYIWLLLLLGLLAVIIIQKQPRKALIAFLALASLLSLWDQTRWQPWFYQYVFMLGAIGVSTWRKNQFEHRHATFDACRLIVVSTYLWAGLQKLNANFVKETFPDIAGAFLRLLPARFQPPLFVGAVIPLIEIAIGLGLLTLKYRDISVVLAILTHAFVLGLLFSSGENTVVWPWNIAMVAFVLILFWRDRNSTWSAIVIPRTAFHVLVLLMFGVLPVLSFVDLWDSYLSSALYSGNTAQAVIYVTPAVIDRLPVSIHTHIWQRSQPYFLDINRWAYGELNVPLYPEPRIYRKVAEQICRDAGSASSDVRLRIKNKPNPITGARVSEYFDCEHLNFIGRAPEP